MNEKDENKIIAYCGFNCRDCPVYKITVNGNKEERKAFLRRWNEKKTVSMKLEELHCQGCTSNLLFRFCMECKIRACCREKDIPNCAYCDDYGCEYITELYGCNPEAKKVLDDIRANL
jgi:hypothetical protein